jgi:hypothetical protein
MSFTVLKLKQDSFGITFISVFCTDEEQSKLVESCFSLLELVWLLHETSRLVCLAGFFILFLAVTLPIKIYNTHKTNQVSIKLSYSIQNGMNLNLQKIPELLLMQHALNKILGSPLSLFDFSSRIIFKDYCAI